MQISTALFLQAQNTAQSQKLSQHSAAKTTAQDITSPFLPAATPSSLKDVITTMLTQLAAEASSKSGLLETLQKSPLFKNLGNFSADMQTLLGSLKNAKGFEKEFLLLQNFQKNIDTVDAKVLQNQVRNSGIFLESTLASKATKEGLSETLKSLSSALTSHLSQTHKTALLTKEITPYLQKLSEPQSLSSQQLQEVLKDTLSLLRQSVKQHLSFEAPSPLKPALALLDTLEKNSKTFALVASKIENAPQQAKAIIETFTANLQETLKALKQEIQTHLQGGASQSIVSQVETLLQQTTLLPQSSNALMADNTLKEQLLLMANRIKQEITLHHPEATKQVNHLENTALLEQKILALSKPELFLSSSLMQKLSLNPEQADILGDIKGTLSTLSEKLTQSTQAQTQNALEITNKLLTNIEYHQLVSYVGSSTHVYIPFVWQGLKEGSMMMKQSSEDAFHCQIDLELEHYGKLHMMLVLSNKVYLDMSIATEKETLKEKVSEHLITLKQSLNEVGIITQSVKLLEYKEESLIKKEYFLDDSIKFGINISV